MSNSNGKKNGKLTLKRIAIRKRRLRIEECLEKAVTNHDQLAAMLGVSRSVIGTDIKAIHKGWLDSDGKQAKLNRTKRVRQLELGARLNLASYERSRQDVEEITTVEKNEKCEKCSGRGMRNETDWCETCGGEGEIKTEVITKKVKGSPGDSSFLGEFRKCIAECARLEAVYPRNKGTGLKRPKVKLHAHVHTGGNGAGKYANAPADVILAAMEALEELKESIAEPKTIDVESKGTNDLGKKEVE